VIAGLVPLARRAIVTSCVCCFLTWQLSIDQVSGPEPRSGSEVGPEVGSGMPRLRDRRRQGASPKPRARGLDYCGAEQRWPARTAFFRLELWTVEGHVTDQDAQTPDVRTREP